MNTIENKINSTIEHFVEIFGDRDCFKTWVENINCGEKFIVWCSFRTRNWCSPSRITVKYRRTITA